MIIGESTSRVRNVVKAVKQDAFVTDRFIYSLIIKYAKLAMKRYQINQMIGFNAFFKTIPCIDLIEIDTIAECCGVTSGIKIKRSKDKLPGIIQGNYGPLVRLVSSIDRYTTAYSTVPRTYNSISNSTSFKYNNNVYYWLLDGYLYIPNVEWDSALMEVIPDGDISYLLCDNSQKCIVLQDQELSVPDFLLAEVESNVIKEMTISLQIPPDPAISDKQNQAR